MTGIRAFIGCNCNCAETGYHSQGCPVREAAVDKIAECWEGKGYPIKSTERALVAMFAAGASWQVAHTTAELTTTIQKVHAKCVAACDGQAAYYRDQNPHVHNEEEEHKAEAAEECGQAVRELDFSELLANESPVQQDTAAPCDHIIGQAAMLNPEEGQAYINRFLRQGQTPPHRERNFMFAHCPLCGAKLTHHEDIQAQEIVASDSPRWVDEDDIA